ncbi:MAG: hypothetical protein ACR2JY_21590 [Chloroflexota bacterium]
MRVTTYHDRASDRQALVDKLQEAANRFFRGATGKSVDFRVTEALSAQELIRSVGGDITAFEARRQNPSRLARFFSSTSPKLVVTLDAVDGVLRALRDGRVSPQQAQQWASFSRRGYVAGATRGPVGPLRIEYDPLHEDDIVNSISRLDEIGDVIDGEVSDEEINDMLRASR